MECPLTHTPLLHPIKDGEGGKKSYCGTSHQSLVESRSSPEAGSPVLTLRRAYNHIGWICSFPPAYFAVFRKREKKKKLFCITVTQSLDTVGTKLLFFFFSFWLPDVRVDHTSTSITHYQRSLIKGASSSTPPPPPRRCRIGLLQHMIPVSAAALAMRAGCYYLSG